MKVMKQTDLDCRVFNFVGSIVEKEVLIVVRFRFIILIRNELGACGYFSISNYIKPLHRGVVSLIYLSEPLILIEFEIDV